MTDYSSALVRSFASASCSLHGRIEDLACHECGVRRTAICGVLDDEQIVDLGRMMTQKWVEPGQFVVLEGDPGDYAYTVTEGIIKVFKSLADGRVQITGFLLPGDFLGMPSRGRFVYSAEAIGRARLCVFPHRPLRALFDRSPGLKKRLFEIVNDELTLAQDHMLLLGRRRADERVACFVLEFAARFARAGWPVDPMTLPVGRGDIADYLGLSLETVSRSFSRLKKAGVLSLPTKSQVMILDAERLERLGGRS
jgi:CRP/FNR family transcriptional regulator